MIQNNLWFVDSGVDFFALVCYSLQNKLTFNEVIIVKYNKNISLNLRKNVLSNIPNIKIIDIIEDSSRSNKKFNFNQLIFFKSLIRRVSKNKRIFSRAGSNINKLIPPSKNSYTLIHGINDYLYCGDINSSCAKVFKTIFLKLIAHIQLKFYGYSNFCRNFGNKLAFNFPIKKNLRINDLKDNYFYLDSNNDEIRKHFEYYFRNLNNFVNSNYFSKANLAKVSYLPISLNSLNLQYDEALEKQFISFNKEILLKFRNFIKEDLFIFINLHPIDLTNTNNSNINFKYKLIKELQENYFNVALTSEYIDLNFLSEITYEITELFLKPKYLISSYLSASLITSQTKAENKFLVSIDNKYIMKYIPDLKKSYNFQKSIDHLYNKI